MARVTQNKSVQDLRELRETFRSSSTAPSTAFEIPTTEQVREETFACGCPVWSERRGCLSPHQCCACRDSGEPCESCGAGGKPVRPAEPDIATPLQVPARYQGARLDNWNAPPFAGLDESARLVAEIYAEYWTPMKPFLAFLSPQKGNGKTRLAVSVLYEVWFRHQQRGQLWNVVELLDAYKRTFRPGAEYELDTLEQMLRRMPLLVIDDLGAQYDTPYAKDRLYGLLNFRYNELLPTIITANVRAEQLDDRIRSRMFDTATACVELLEGPDRRRMTA